jgi:tetratricopeptide (TPR) repeat protein
VYLARAISHRALDDRPAALRDLQAGLALRRAGGDQGGVPASTAAGLLHVRALLRHEAGDAAAALDDARQAAALAPGDAAIGRSLARVYYARGWFGLALSEAERALAIDPDDPASRSLVDAARAAAAAPLPPAPAPAGSP